MMAELGFGVFGFLLLGLTGCSLIPPASIQYLESLPKGALQQAEPKNVRVAINLPEGVKIKNLVANITGEHKNDTVTAKLPFYEISQTLVLSPALSDGSGKWTYYALTKEGLGGFRKIQAFVSRHPLGSGRTTVTVKIHHKLELTNCARKGSMPLLAAIFLDPKRGYVTVWDHDVSLSDLAKPKDRVCSHAPGDVTGVFRPLP